MDVLEKSSGFLSGHREYLNQIDRNPSDSSYKYQPVNGT